MRFRIDFILKAILLVCCISATASAQLLPPNQPEQDACGALTLCGGSFSSPYSYQGIGAINNLNTTPCGSGEANSVWLKLTVSTSGTMVFTISPVSVQDDYDFAVLNITNTSCSNFSQANVVRCNFNNNSPGSNVNGVIGLNTTSTQQFVAGGTQGSSFCQQINATAGQVFLIMINNFGNYATGGPSSGFNINFAGSTATFNTPPPPQMDSVLAPDCNYKNEVTIKLRSEVKCSSIAANGSDFNISPSGTIISAQGINCNGSQGYTDRIKLTFGSTLSPGNYFINAQQGTDGNTLLDFCNNGLILPGQVPFTVKDFNYTVSLTRCSNQMPFVWNGVNVTAGGNAVATVRRTSVKGCDSVVTLNLTVLPSYSGVENIAICSNQLPYSWKGITVNAAGQGTAVYRGTNRAGCDSLITLNLTLLPAYNGNANVSICSSQLPYTWNGTVVTTGGSGAAVYRGTRSNGCDSVVTLNLSVQPSYNNTATVNICSTRLPYTWNGMLVNSGGNGAATYRTTTRFGCDSIVTLNLNVGTPKAHTVNLSICANQLPYTWNGITVTAGGNNAATFTAQTPFGCDSVVTLNLTVKSIYTSVENKTICSTALPYIWNGITVTAGGPNAATYRGVGVAGCDSTVTLNLTVLPAALVQVNMTRCARELPFTWNGFNITTGGTAVATYVTTSVNGCDSTVKLNLTVQQTGTLALTTEGCDSVRFKGKMYTANETVNDTLRYRTGCDSIYRTVNIVVHHTNLTSIVKDTAGCGYLPFNGVVYHKDTVVVQKYTDVHGCDSLIITNNITIHPNNPASLILDQAGCDSLFFESAFYKSDTTLHDILKSRWGCDSVLRTVRIRIEHFELALAADLDSIVNGEEVQLSASGNGTYNVIAWTPVSQFPDQNASVQHIRPAATEVYQVIGKTLNGCTDSATIRIVVDPLNANAFMPNAFTPNGDGLNDYFSPTFFSKRGYVIEAFDIFNRWGQKVFAGHGTNVRWNGTYNNKPADMGTYFYNIILSFVNGKQIAVKGNVELLR